MWQVRILLGAQCPGLSGSAGRFFGFAFMVLGIERRAPALGHVPSPSLPVMFLRWGLTKLLCKCPRLSLKLCPPASASLSYRQFYWWHKAIFLIPWALDGNDSQTQNIGVSERSTQEETAYIHLQPPKVLAIQHCGACQEDWQCLRPCYYPGPCSCLDTRELIRCASLLLSVTTVSKVEEKCPVRHGLQINNIFLHLLQRVFGKKKLLIKNCEKILGLSCYFFLNSKILFLGSKQSSS